MEKLVANFWVSFKLFAFKLLKPLFLGLVTSIEIKGIGVYKGRTTEISKVMIPRKELITAGEGLELSDAIEILEREKKGLTLSLHIKLLRIF